ncbi:MAG: glycosyltransferase, partial [Candidatus Omnitrophica bacterium]|nr:glycosyltransferase [Candidatus Omnitrophota bacterium]
TDFPITVLLVGGGDFSFSFPPNIKVVKVGFIGDDRLLSLCYGVSDVYLSMSKADNLPNTLIEALACGTPIITLDSGGCRDAVVSEETGYVASNSQEVIASLKELLTDNSKSTDFSKRSRTLAQKRFSMEAQVESYAALAQKIKGN